MAKITQLQVAIIGIILSVLAAAGIFIGLIKPQTEALAEQQSRIDTLTPDASEAKKATAIKDIAKAEGEVRDAKRDWAVYDRRYMPRINLANLFTATQQLWTEETKVFMPNITKFLYADKTVRVVSQNLAVPAPVADPNYVARRQFTWPLGTVTVTGTFEQVMKHVERWNKFNRLVLADGLTLSGNSPGITATYTLTAYIFTQADVAGPAIPQAGTPAGGAGGFGPPGGFPGGFPGGPPGGFPGGPPGGFPGGPPTGAGFRPPAGDAPGAPPGASVGGDQGTASR